MQFTFSLLHVEFRTTNLMGSAQNMCYYSVIWVDYKCMYGSSMKVIFVKHGDSAKLLTVRIHTSINCV